MMRLGERGNSKNGLWKRRANHRQGNNPEILRRGRTKTSRSKWTVTDIGIEETVFIWAALSK